MVARILYPELKTPAVLVDMDRLEANIREMSDLCKSAGVKLRAHVKVHMCADIVKMQMAAGAYAVELGTVYGAEALAEAGINDILIAHPTSYTGDKTETLKRLLKKRGQKTTVVLDMVEQAQTVSQIGQELGKKVPVALKVDVNAVINGFSRFGVLPEATLKVAKEFVKLPGIDFKGLYAHEMPLNTTKEGLEKAALDCCTLMVDTAKLLKKEGIPVEHLSVGGSPTIRPISRFMREGKFREITEVHPGNFVIGDISYMKEGGNTREMCAGSVLVTVTSTAHPEKAIIDAGFKTFGGDYMVGAAKEPDYWWNGWPTFGEAQGRLDLRCGFLSAEVGSIYYMDPYRKLEVGERIEIVPNNITLVIAMHDQIYGVRRGRVERTFAVTGHGRGI